MREPTTRMTPKYETSALGTHLVSIKAYNTDLGNARRLVAQRGQDLRYCPELKTWFFWDTARWMRDKDGEISRHAKDVVLNIHIQAYQEGNEAAREKLGKWAVQSEAYARIGAMIRLAETEPRIPVSVSDFDANHFLLGVTNGVIDLRTGELRKPKRQDYTTKQAPVCFDPNAQCSQWLSFIEYVTGGDEALEEYLQRIVGYWLTGNTSEQCIFILYGRGANGKTVFLRVIQALMGDYAMMTPPETLMVKKNTSGPSPDLARLHGARLAIATEPKDDCALAEQVVKQITGQDTIVCRHLYGNLFEYAPQFKVVLATNHKPIIRGDDHAIWRRIQLIPFTVTIPPEEQDKQLIEKLLPELPGILNWALQGVLAYRDQGLAPPECVRKAIQQYRSEMDILGDWIEERCTLDPSATTPASELYVCYRQWCQANGHRPLSKKKFGMKLDDRGFERDRTGKVRSYLGLVVGKPVMDDLMNQTSYETFDTG